MPKRLMMIAATLLIVTGVVVSANGAWIYAKARLAQVLLRLAWAETLRGTHEVKPWPWADTHPVASLSFPGQHERLIVLAGASGRTMAFAPGHVDGTAEPGRGGNCVISGHRDTQFLLLENVNRGDAIVLESVSGKRLYHVTSLRVVDSNDVSVLRRTAQDRLTLITCYPFHQLVPGGPLRYVVVAS
ncbi:MAG TPA: class GN sortase [Thermoanaerobaculia bacterium]|nr:class GN sortase [Thermoanaerobaculia bacterium]